MQEFFWMNNLPRKAEKERVGVRETYYKWGVRKNQPLKKISPRYEQDLFNPALFLIVANSP
jgi:hypothetical protein